MLNFYYEMNKLKRLLKNKYFITIVIFIIWLIFFDQNNLLQYLKFKKQYKKLLEDKKYYIKKIKEDSEKIYELQTDAKTIEKFARENFYMKKPDEDLFVIIEK